MNIQLKVRKWWKPLSWDLVRLAYLSNIGVRIVSTKWRVLYWDYVVEIN